MRNIDCWTVTGCRYYNIGAVKLGDEVRILKHPIPEHPWNIAVFHGMEQVGTLTARRIERVYASFPEEGMYGAVRRFVRNKYDVCTQMEIDMAIQ
jgi:hypothetical protein